MYVKLLYVKDGLWQSYVICVKLLCIWQMVCDKVEVIVCERWSVTKLCVKFVYVKLWKDGMWQSCMLSLCMWKFACERWYVTKLCVKFVCVRDGMWQSCVCECVEEEAGGGGEEATRDTESKTRTPHKVVGN